MTQPKQRGGRRAPGPGKTMGAPKKERPAGSTKRLLAFHANQEQWDLILDGVTSDTTERTAWIIEMIQQAKESGE
jgi:hypothetical protein